MTMFPRVRTVVVAVLLVFAGAAGSRAQEIPELAPETRVWVTTADAREREGVVVSLSPFALVLRGEAALESIAVAEVRRIETRDSLRNGFRNGALVGAIGLGGFAAYLSQALCEISDGCFRHDVGRILLLAGVGAAAGGAAGSLVDYAIAGRRVVYASGEPARAVRVALMTRGRGVGLRLHLTWR